MQLLRTVSLMSLWNAALLLWSCALPTYAAADETLRTNGDAVRESVAGAVLGGPTPVSGKGDASSIGLSLQLREEAEVRTPLIRLGDVVSLAGVPPEDWSKLSAVVIGILPSELDRVRLERRRIAEFLASTGRLGRSVRWIGPEFTVVKMAASPEVVRRDKVIGLSPAANQSPTRLASQSQNAAKSPAFDEGPTTVAADAMPQNSLSQKSMPRKPIAQESASQSSPLLPAQRNRLERLLLGFFSQTHEEIFESYDVAIDPTDIRLSNLQDIQSVTAMRLLDTPVAGTIDVEVIGDDGTRRVAEEIRLKLDPLPMVVFAKSTLNRGDIVGQDDVMLKPIPKNQFDDRMATDLSSIIGQQSTRALSSGRPLRMEDVSRPIVIKRGDLVEVHVMAAGFKITTQGKAMESGGVGDAVTVEIDQPRRRVMGRAARYGVVEILSRPPVVSQEPSANE